MPDFVIAVPEGALAASVGATLDVLSIAGRSAAARGRKPMEWRVVSTRRQIPLSGGMTLAAERLDRVAIQPHAVVVIPGIGLDHPKLDSGGNIRDRYREDRLRQRMNMPDMAAFAAMAAEHGAHGGKVAASCSGVFVLGMAGLLDGRTATTHWQLGDFLQRCFPLARLDVNRMLVDERGVISAGAAMAQMDLMLYLIRHRAGRDVADLAMKYLLVDSRTTQARYRVWDQLQTDEEGVAARFEALIEASLPMPPSIAEAASQLHMTAKTLSRHIARATGSTPMNLVHTIRMRHAQRLLALGELSLDEVAQRLGYANATSLRKLTMKMARLPPAMFRHPVSGGSQ
ncbi:GlxA family transcriptional regulator [Thauera butanivorans]|uniref:GlxA family transcriptional regulator n=1 Tax=Thauera butanivorans TaxID=86174 RepID=UPI003AB278C9